MPIASAGGDGLIVSSQKAASVATGLCPVNAIFAEDDLPVDQREFLQLNAELAAIWPNITSMKAAPPDAAQWKDVPGKRKLLER